MKKRVVFLLVISLMLLFSCTLLISCENGKEDIEEGSNMYLILVNKQNPVGNDYIPDGLVELDTDYTTGGKPIKLERAAAEAAVRMLDDMADQGIANVSITSGYRTYEYQESLFNKYCAQEGAAHPAWSDEEVKEYVLTYSAYPGTSEHQTGLCMDLFTTEMEGLWNYGSETPSNPYDKGFAETDAYEWLCENAHKYGFVLRFPEDKTDVTGYSYESWHYRYVGENAADKMHKSGLTLEEYLQK